MTATLPTTPGDIARAEPFVFTATGDVTSVSMQFFLQTDGDPDDPASVPTGPRETVFDGTDALNGGGTFSHQYRDSTRDGDEWTIRRDSGWPRPFRVAVKEATGEGGSGSISPQAALQPTLYSPVAQYALQGAPNTARLYIDRSGNNRHLTAGNADAAIDLIAGQTCIEPITQTQPGRLKCVGQAALAITGALTITCRIRRSSGGTILVQSGIFGAGNTQNTLFTLSAPGGVLYYFWEKTAGDSQDVTSSIGLPESAWAFFSFRRTAGGTPTFGVNGTYETPAGSFVGPTGGSNSFLTIGDHDESGMDGAFDGRIADVCIWNVRLTDDELVPLRAAAMGL